jgi:phenylalanyl-tRNA synthetase alpha chain
MLQAMREKLEQIRAKAMEAMEGLHDLTQLEEFRVKTLGKKGELTLVLREMGSLPAEERPVMGQLANEIRSTLERELSRKTAELKEAELEKRLESETIDVTIPGKRPALGGLHPLTIVLNELEEIFLGMGFDVAEGPEVEYDLYNFEYLNIPQNHPARDVQDQRQHPAAHSYLSGSDSNHAEAEAPCQNHLPRQGIPFGCGGCHPFPHFPSD